MSKVYFSSLLILTILFGCSVGKGKDYLKINKVLETYKYTDSSCYSRAIAVNNGFLFIANSNGKVIKTDLVKKVSTELKEEGNCEELRDIAVIEDRIYAMQSGETGKVIEFFQTADHQNTLEYSFWKGVFLDGMDFYKKTGFIMGDPINGYFSLYHTKDGGNKWVECVGKVKANNGEAGYAASGTNVQVLNDSTFFFASGGSKNRFFKTTDCGKTWYFTELPFNTGEVIGCFSICFKNENEGIAVGGDHNNPLNTSKTCFYTSDGGITWTESLIGIRGFRSCLLFKNGIYYSCGKNGIDYSNDNGVSWKPFADGNFFAMTSDKKYLYATTTNASFVKIKLVQ